jgi:hypothetical protein
VTVTDAANKDEIDLDNLDDLEEEEDYDDEAAEREENFELEQKSVPRAVFGSAAHEVAKNKNKK